MPDVSNTSKYTRGEKCIIAHLVFTFVFLLISLMIYIVHLCMVSHVDKSAFLTRRVAHDDNEVVMPNYLPIGRLYLKITPPRPVCNTIHLREKWSVTPAHCAVIRTDPDMNKWLSQWRINYRGLDLKYMVTEIKRSIPHPHFNKDDFSNNIGLLEHITSIPIHQYIPLNPTTNIKNIGENEIMQLAEWAQTVVEKKDFRLSQLKIHSINIMDRVKCNFFIAAIVEIRDYEFCATILEKGEVKFEKPLTVAHSIMYECVVKAKSALLWNAKHQDHGAAVLQDNNVTGFFSWGEREGKNLPFIAIHISDYIDWLRTIVSLQNNF